MLSRDLRVKQALLTWLEAPTSKQCVFDLRLAERAEDTETIEYLLNAERPRFVGVLLPALKPLSIPPWLEDLLWLYAWRFAGPLQFEQPLPSIIYGQLDRPLSTRAKRLPKGGAEHIIRDVLWFYRVHVKHPPDTYGELGREYIRARIAEKVPLSAETDGKVVVKAGILRAKGFLGLN